MLNTTEARGSCFCSIGSGVGRKTSARQRKSVSQDSLPQEGDVYRPLTSSCLTAVLFPPSALLLPPSSFLCLDSRPLPPLSSVVISGAATSGCATALLLARAGAKVTLVD